VGDSGLGLDDNPDVNAGTTIWGDGLGSGWACDNSTLAYPMGDKNAATGPGNGDAFIACESLQGPYALGDNETAGVIAVISFAAVAAGTDTMTIKSTSYLAYSDASPMGKCDPADPVVPISCNGGSDTNGGAPVPAPTSGPAPIAPPPEVPPEVAPPPVVPGAPPVGVPAPVIVAPPTGSGPAGDGFPWTPLGLLLAGAVGTAIAAGGLLRLARARQR